MIDEKRDENLSNLSEQQWENIGDPLCIKCGCSKSAHYCSPYTGEYECGTGGIADFGKGPEIWPNKEDRERMLKFGKFLNDAYERG